ncbi:MAG: UpxY family transcription antiterminator [Tannerella sp.]|jgi:transcription antitermination factor NusG|nr:UpxY family transcription antiterminator [Tannerella sp.]
MADLLTSETKSKTNWYAFYCLPRAEKKVKDRLEALGKEAYLPLHRAPRAWSDRVKMVDIPLFPSYIFIRCREGELHPLLREVHGVIRIVYHCGRPAVIRPQEIDAIRRFLELAVERPLCEGEEVEILAGSFRHISGKIRKIKKKYLILYIEPLGSLVSIDLTKVARLNRLK